MPVDSGRWHQRLTGAPPGVRILASEDLHLTLAFFGPVEEASARAAFDIAVSARLTPMEVQLGAIVALGSARRPSALGASLGEGNEELSRVLLRLRDPLADAAGARRETRPPLPHVTLARPRRRATPVERQAAVQWAESLELGAPRVRLARVALYTWAEDRSGPRQFRIVDDCALQA